MAGCSISTAAGSALVRLGETTMVCGITAELAEPDLATPDHGFVVPNIDLPAICSPKFKPGPPGELAQVLSSWLNDLVVSSRTLDPAKLCIAPGKSCWVIYIDVVCINFDGTAFDAAVMAVMAALRNTRLPRATYNPDTAQTLCSRTETYPLPLGRLPLACSFGVFDSTHLLPDPTSFEAPFLPTTITIALDERSRPCFVRQAGLAGTAAALGPEVMESAWAMAEARARELRGVLEEAG